MYGGNLKICCLSRSLRNKMPVSPSWRSLQIQGVVFFQISPILSCLWEGNSPFPQKSSYCADLENPLSLFLSADSESLLSSSKVFFYYILRMGKDRRMVYPERVDSRPVGGLLSSDLVSLCPLSVSLVTNFWVTGKSLCTTLPHTDIRLNEESRKKTL